MSLEEVQDLFLKIYLGMCDSLLDETPNLRYWFRSGPYDGAKDIPRRMEIGLEQVAKYIEYCLGKGKDDTIWFTPDGEPAIELGFDIDLDGVQVKGYIDQVSNVLDLDVTEPEVITIPTDVKSGNNPGGDKQLGVYAVALEIQYGIPITAGQYFMTGKKGKPVKVIRLELDAWSRESMTREFHKLEENIQAEIWDADPEPDKCMFCSVSFACKYKA